MGPAGLHQQPDLRAEQGCELFACSDTPQVLSWRDLSWIIDAKRSSGRQDSIAATLGACPPPCTPRPHIFGGA